MLYMKSFIVSQNDILQSLNRIAEQEFRTTHVASQQALRDWKAKMDDGDDEAIERAISVLGLTRTQFNSKLSNEALELPVEDLDEIVAQAYKSSKSRTH